MGVSPCPNSLTGDSLSIYRNRVNGPSAAVPTKAQRKCATLATKIMALGQKVFWSTGQKSLNWQLWLRTLPLGKGYTLASSIPIPFPITPIQNSVRPPLSSSPLLTFVINWSDQHLNRCFLISRRAYIFQRTSSPSYKLERDNHVRGT